MPQHMISSSSESYEPLLLKVSQTVQVLFPKRVESGPSYGGVVAISDDNHYFGIMESSVDRATQQITVYTLPDLTVSKIISPIDPKVTGVSFTPNGKDIILLNESSRYELIDDWEDEHPRRVSPKTGASSVARPQRALFSRNGTMMIITNELTSHVSSTVGRPSPFATVIRNWRSERPWKGGEIQNRRYENLEDGDSDFSVLFDKGDITSLGVMGEDYIVTTDAGAELTIWEALFRFGSSKIRFDGTPDVLTILPDGAQALVLEQEGDYYTIQHVNRYYDVTPSVTSLFRMPYPSALPPVSRPLPAISDNGELIATIAGNDARNVQRIAIYSIAKKTTIRTIDIPQSNEPSILGFFIGAIAFGPGGRDVLVGHEDGRIFVWSLENNDNSEPKAIVKISETFAHDIGFQFSHDGALLIVSFNREIQLWDNWTSSAPVLSGRWTVSNNGSVSIVSSSVSANDDYLAVGVSNGETIVWKNWKTPDRQVIRRLSTTRDPEREELPAALLGLVFHPHENVLATLDRRGITVVGVDRADLPPVYLKRPTLRNTSGNLVFSPDGRYIVSTSSSYRDYIVWLWRANDLIRDGVFVLPLDRTQRQAMG